MAPKADASKQCSVCDQKFATSREFYVCGKCGSAFHNACSRPATVLDDNGMRIKACISCITDAGSPCVTRSNSVSSRSSASRPATPEVSASSVQQLISKLDKVDLSKLEKLDNLEGKVDDILSKLDLLPAVLAKLNEHEGLISEQNNRLKKLAEDQETTAKKLDNFIRKSKTPSAQSSEPRLRKLEEDNAQLQARLAGLSSRLSTELVLSGLRVDGTINLRSLAYTVLKALYPLLEQRDVVAASLLHRRNTDAPPSASVTTSSASTSTTAMVEPHVEAGMSRHSSDSPPILVKLSSHALMHELIEAKIKKRKLHTAELDKELLSASGVTADLTPGLINVNEFLPKDVHQLRAKVRAEAKRRNFMTFIRDGNIFVRRDRMSAPLRICSELELQDFVQTLQ